MADDDKHRRKQLIADPEVFAEICKREALAQAWGKVWQNGGAAGGDRITVRDFAARAHLNLGLLSNALAEGSYRPGPVRSVQIPKRRGERPGETRLLRIPCVVDRVAQTAAAMALSPLFEEEFEDSSFGFRPGRSIYQAVAQIQSLQRSGFTHVIEADIEDYFDSVPHDGLLSRLSESLSDGPLTELISLWLSDAAPQGRGLAQGSPLSPLLANLYLDRLDEALSRNRVRIIRFADDFVILTESRDSAEQAFDQAARWLGRYGLELNPDKSRISDFSRGFKFLGHMFVRSMALKVAPEDQDEWDSARALQQISRQDAAEEELAEWEESQAKRDEAAGYAAGLRNLYLMQDKRRLSIRNQAFTVEELEQDADPLSGAPERWRELIAVPHDHLDRVDIGPHAAATPEALDHALSTDTTVCFVDGHGETRGVLARALAPNAKRHLAQASTCLDEAKRLELARLLVEGRLRNQRALLRKLTRERDAAPKLVSKALAEMTRLIGRGDVSRIRHAASVAQVMGYEGAASAVYWRALSVLCHPEFRFDSRDRETPGPANIALNFLSWLLHRDVLAAILKAGLHPGFGALHTTDDRRDACVYDLMEEFRAHMIEGLFVYLTNRRMLRPDMFRTEKGGWRMKRAGSEALIKAYEGRAAGLVTWPRGSHRSSFRQMMVRQAFALVRHHEKGGIYEPFEIDY